MTGAFFLLNRQSQQPIYLLRSDQRQASRLAQRYAGASSSLDGLPSSGGESMSLNGQARGLELARAHHFGDFALGLGGELGLLQRLKAHHAPFSRAVQLLQGDEIEDFTGVARAHRAPHHLGQAAVQRNLATLKPRALGAPGTTALTAHSETTCGTLPCSNTTTLTRFALEAARCALQIGESENRTVRRVVFVRLAALPIEQLHGHCRRRGRRLRP
mmetsp:Transcript_27686/g.46928  ORF Transcript_27686/g.46928 Transcript_27686/m.46928 type:complete len:216 (-) Transcript_27686:109-756(-)